MLSCKIDENLELRLHSKIYAEKLCSTIHKNLEHLSEYMIWATEDYSIELAENFIETSRKEFAETELPNLFIFENEELIGNVGCVRPNLPSSSVEIGYWLDKDYTGKGVMTRCCDAIIKHIFNDLELNRIVLRCEPQNTKSAAIAERLGFTKEGIAREVEKKHDKFVDLIVYSMLKKEWEKQ